MWNLLIFLAFLIVHIQGFYIPPNVTEKCQTDNNITREEFFSKIEQAQAENHVENIEMKYMCNVRCLALEMNMLDANGHLDIEVFKIVEQLRGKNIEVVEMCSQLNNMTEDLCKYSFEMMLCLIENLVTTEFLNVSPGRV